MNPSILAAIRCSLLFIVPSVTYAISTQWDLDPISGDWNTAANWTPNGVPNGPADTATFGLSNTTDVSISANTEVNGITFTSAATNPYTVGVNPGITLTLSGVGITNNSGITQSFFLSGSDEPGRSMQFSNRSSAGSATIFADTFSSIDFFNRSTAGSATVNWTGIGASVQFFNTSTAGNLLLGTDGVGVGNSITFHDHSTAGSATLTPGDSGRLFFFDHSSAGNATLSSFLNADIGFFDSSSAGSATIRAFGFIIPAFIDFSDSSSAGSATIQGYGAQISFAGLSKGGTAAIGLFFFDFFDGVSSSLGINHNVTIGSLEGDETAQVFLGANNLTIGSNNLSTTFSGVIQGTGGSLTKIGTGTLDLTENNTYTGNTNVNRGVLQVDGAITGDTFVNHRGTLAGTGIINGNVMNNDFGTVRPGGAVGAPGMLSIVHDYTQTQYATLMIQIAGTNTGDFSLLNVLGNANLNGFLDPVLLNGLVPTIGDSFVFLKYASLTGGGFQILNPVFNHGTEQWSVAYLRNRAILTVEQHTPGVPDQGSTFLLLTLGLLGLVTCRRQLLRG
jgi:autotransporter-associated beta strand protein